MRSAPAHWTALQNPLLAAVAALAIGCFAPALLNDADTYWHVAAGGWMLKHHSLLTFDPFSYTFAGQPWQTHEWLSEILLASAYQLTGWSGVVLLSALAFAATAAILTWYLGRFLSGTALAATALLALSCTMGSLLARPHLLALPILTLWSVVLIAARDRKSAPPIAWAPLMTLWTNLHGSFLFGLAVIVPLATEAVLEAREDRVVVAGQWAAFAALAAGAALVTPFGINGFLFPLRLMQMGALGFVGEWQPTDFSRMQPLTACVLALIYVAVTRRMRISVVRLVVIAGLVYLAAAHVRHNMIAGIVGALLLAKPLGGALANRPSEARRPILVAVLASALVLLPVIRVGVPVERKDDAVSPISAVQHVPATLKNAPVLNDYAFGGYLIFAGVRPYIDSRAEVYGDAFLQNYARIATADREAIAQAVNAKGIAWTLLSPANPAVTVFDHLPGWRRAYADHWAVVHVRAGMLRASAE